jgi:predicted permease
MFVNHPISAAMDSFLRDLSFAIRGLRRAPGFTAVAALTIALGIGGSTAIFSVVNTVLLRPLPFGSGEQLVRVQQTVGRPDGSAGRVGVSQLNFIEIRRRSGFIESAVAHRFRSLTVTGGDDPQRVVGIQVSDRWLPTIGVAPLLGRGFTPDEERLGADARVVMLGFALWQSRFGGAPSAVGGAISLDGVPHTIIGVMPRGYAYPYTAQLWVPLRVDAARGESRDMNVTARLRPGASLEQLQRELDGITGELVREHAVNRQMAGLVARPLRVELVGDFARVLLALLGAVAFVLLIACVNVANLLLTRGAARQREFAIRAALGASRARQIRLLLTESLLLSCAGGVLGAAAAVWVAGAFTPLIPESMRDVVPAVQIDPQLLGFALAISVLTGLVFGSYPAWSASRPNLSEVMKAGASANRRGLRPLQVLVVAEVALSVVLLVGGGLLVRDLELRLSAETGIDIENAMTLSIGFPETRYAATETRVEFLRALEERMAAERGITAAGMSTIIPFGSSNTVATVQAEGSVFDSTSSANHRLVTAGYFDALGIPLVRGRLITPRDVASALPVAVISQSMARRFWPGEDPIGRRVRQTSAEGAPWVTVIGVVGDVQERDGMAETWYLPYAQGAQLMPVSFATLRIVVVARGASGADATVVSAVRRAIRALDPSLPVFDVAALRDLHVAEHGTARLGASISAAFAGLGLVLAAIGIYGVVSYATSRRRREIGVRMALGARGEDVLRDVLVRGGSLVAAGLAIGLACALATSRLVSSLLAEVPPYDPVTFFAVVVVLGFVGLVAAYVPARRAARIDPMQALREE